MIRQRQFSLAIVGLLFVLSTLACGGSPDPTPTPMAEGATPVAVPSLAPDETKPSSPSGPSWTPPEAPIGDGVQQAGVVPEIPEAFVVQQNITIDELAYILKTNVAAIRYVNRRIDDAVQAKTFIVIPDIYISQEGETLQDIANVTDVSLEDLVGLNDSVGVNEPLPSSKRVVLPRGIMTNNGTVNRRHLSLGK